MLQKPRYLFYISLIIIGVLGAAYAYLWHQGANSMETIIDDWIKDQRQNGMVIQHGDIHITGFPFILRALINNADLSQPGQWRWQTETFAIDVLPYDFNRLVFSPQGNQRVLFYPLDPPYREWSGSAEDIRASLGRDKTHDWFFILDINHGTLKTITQHIRLNSEKFLINIAPNGQESSALSASIVLKEISGILPASPDQKAITLNAFETAFSITNTDGFIKNNNLKAWAQQGGTFNLQHFLIAKEEARFSANGRLSIDENGYPEGTILTRLVKPAAFITAAKQSGYFDKAQIDTITGGLVFAALSSGGVIETPLLLKNGIFSTKDQTISTLPKLD